MTGKKKHSSAPLPPPSSSEPASSLSSSSSFSPLSNECNRVFGILHNGTYSKALEAAKSLVSRHPDSALANALIALVYKDIAAGELNLSFSLSNRHTHSLSLSLKVTVFGCFGHEAWGFRFVLFWFRGSCSLNVFFFCFVFFCFVFFFFFFFFFQIFLIFFLFRRKRKRKRKDAK